MTLRRLSLSLIFLSGTFSSPVLAQSWALDGFDPVEIRSHGRVISGRGDIVTRWRGQSWHFSSEENRAAFEANPRAFVPGFDGLCPVALADGREIKGDAGHAVIEGQRIYLLRSETAERALRADPKGVLDRARAAWVKRSQ